MAKEQLNKIPDIIGKNVKDARDFLKRKKIKVNKKVVPVFNLGFKSGTVFKTEPPIGSKVKENDKVTLYVAKNRMFTLMIALIIFIIGLVFMIITNVPYVHYNPIGPVIEINKTEYAKVAVIKVIEKSELDKKEDYYQYCITLGDNPDKCNWNTIKNNSISISDTGVWNVYMRAVSVDGVETLPSNKVVAKIDRTGPEIKSVTSVKNKNSAELKIDAEDKQSGIDNYYYSLDGETYNQIYNKFELKNLSNKIENEIYIKVTDKLGNSTIYKTVI